MAPILATTTGVTPQVLDDSDLVQLLQSLNDLQLVETNVCLLPRDHVVPREIEVLCNTLEPWHKEWLFEEQIDLHEWIHPLNVMDSALTWILQNHASSILLVDPLHRVKSDAGSCSPAIQLQQIHDCPVLILHQISVILQFTAALLRNSISKTLYASVPAVADLLGAADDNVSDYAVSVLAALSIPPALHKQQGPEHVVHTTALHHTTNGTAVHERLIATARAWGTRSMGLGLFATVTADDSVHGQGMLAASAGQVNFFYYKRCATIGSEESSRSGSSMDQSNLQEITLGLQEILIEQSDASSMSDGSAGNVDDADHEASNKRRRVLCSVLKKEARSTAELFFIALEKAGGRENIPNDRLFSLLCDIRLARSFHTRATRIQAVQRRLLALVAVLHTHPPNEIMSAFFQTQPELTVEIIDLLRSTVSIANVSSVTPSDNNCTHSRLQLDAISSLVDGISQNVPYNIRMLALESLTALVSLRDSSTSALSGSVRLSNVLTELGVGKGQYLGLLPTLIRCSLAALNSPSESRSPYSRASDTKVDCEMNESFPHTFEIGLAFAEVTMPLPIDRRLQVERALMLIDNVLTLTSAVVGTPTGAPALVDCGLIPALLSTVGLDMETALLSLVHHTPPDRHLKALFRFITAQAVQILEGSIVSHKNALSAFHDLKGVETLTARLSKEILSTRQSSLAKKTDGSSMKTDSEMKNAEGEVSFEVSQAETLFIVSSLRVVLFSIVTCLTVVFHQETSPSTTLSLSGGSQLRKKELTESVIQILYGVQWYGGHLASLIATLLSDVMNNDPHIVQYVHQSGIAKAFLSMIKGKQLADGTFLPIVPPVPELVMGIPSVISALSLTEEGAKAVEEQNPFPSLLRLFHHPNYAMPKSKCLLNEMTAIVGTGLDEIMRHVERLKPLILTAVAEAMGEVVKFSEEVLAREDSIYGISGQFVGEGSSEMENERSCLIQYILNFGQLLEQILHHEEHCDPFVEAGGLDALLKLFPSSIPSDSQFLAYLSCLSSPSVSTLHHSTAEETLSQALKCIEFRYDPCKLIRKLVDVASSHMDAFEDSQRTILSRNTNTLLLDAFPRQCVYEISDSNNLKQASEYLRNVAQLQWITTVLANALKAASQRNSEAGSGWSRSEREWKKELSSKEFEAFVTRLSTCYCETLFEVCRVRTEPDFEESEVNRLKIATKDLCFRLRIVCPEGAVVRDGIEIDSCANVGNMEMGDIVDSYDRCINSSGILRYRTCRGWVSEMTRGHGREPIAEVISVTVKPRQFEYADNSEENKKRIEAGIPYLRTVAVGVLARGHACYSDFFGSLSKVAIQGIRSLPGRAITFEEGSPGAHVRALMKLLAANFMLGIGDNRVSKVLRHELGGNVTISESGAAIFYGCYLSQAHVCMFDDKRETRLVNFALLVILLATDPYVKSVSSNTSAQSTSEPPGLFDVVKFVFSHGLSDLASRASGDESRANVSESLQRVGRSVAASFPPLLSLLRKLISTPFSSSPSASIMSRIKRNDVSRLLGIPSMLTVDSDSFFSPESIVSDLQVAISKVVKEIWTDPRIVFVPPFLLHPLTSLVDEIIVNLQDSSKKKSANSFAVSRHAGVRLSELTRLRQEGSVRRAVHEESFEPSEETISQLMEMGFSRDHALDALESTGTNRIETAMDYALSNPPGAETLERRRVERAERARIRAESSQRQVADADQESATAENSAAENSSHLGEIDVPTNMDANGGVQEADASSTIGENRTDKGIRVSFAADLSMWLETVPEVVCKVMSSRRRRQVLNLNKDVKQGVPESHGDGENEALTVVLCTFLLDLCHRYPEKRSDIVSKVLTQAKNVLTKSSVDQYEEFRVDEDNEASVASFCHAAVLITRALPMTRLIVLKEGLTGSLLSCIRSFLSLKILQTNGEKYQKVLPLWFAPALLLLDTMSQPMVAFSDEEMVKSIMEVNPDSDFLKVRSDHKDQIAEVARLTQSWFSLCSANDTQTNSPSHKPSLEQDVVSDIAMEVECPSIELTDTLPFPAVPAYFPLMSSEATQHCVDICCTLLGANQESNGTIILPPGIAHAVLLLLLRLLRSPKVSSQCIQLGVAEAILALPSDSRFTGITGLITLVLRRLLEDEPTLQAAMETEIRATFAKLVAKKSSVANVEKPVVALSAFMEAVTPLLCRQPSSFLKAMSLSVQVVHTKNETNVSILSPADRFRVLSSVTETGLSTSSTLLACTDAGKEDTSRHKRLSSGGKSKGKLPQKAQKRQSFSKRGKKDKVDSMKSSSQSANDSPATHVTFLIINSIVAVSADDAQDIKESFLWTGNLLEILADLVLAVPACAAAVHNYRLNRAKDKGRKYPPVAFHSLCGIPTPSRSFVSFLLYSLVPQDRWTIRYDPKIWDRRKAENEEDAKATKAKKRLAYRTMKMSQAAARVLIALVVRPGEGRKRVIADLVFALSSGSLGHGVIPPSIHDFKVDGDLKNIELEGLPAWGELCLGLIAPRSNGKNLDGTSSLCIDNIRIMLEYGMVHALLFAIHRVQFHHPMASTTCSALLLPLEVLIRPTVNVAVKELVSKESALKEQRVTNDKNTVTVDRVAAESLVDGSFNHDTENPNVSGSNLSSFGAVTVSRMNHLSAADSLDGLEVDDDGGSVDDDESDSDESDEQSEEDEDDEESDLDEMNDEEGRSEMEEEEDDEEEEEEDEEASSDEIVDEGGWDVDYNDTFPPDSTGVRQEIDDGGDEGTERIDENVDEGWTRIDSNGFGGMFLGGRLSGFSGVGDRNRGFIDATETMIHTLIRNGDISGDALAEIEGSLGIRILSGHRDLRTVRASLRSGDSGEHGVGDSVALRVFGTDGHRDGDRDRNDVVGTMPHIHQRSQPDIGYSAFGRGQGIDISSMEYVYGGPSVTGGSRNYDLITPFREEPDMDQHYALTQLDLHLFPGGPSSAASARTQHSLHPLLCGVDLPPVNSLVSDLLPHGVRATRRGHMTTRRPGDFSNASFAPGGYLVSTSNGNILRSSRSHPSAPLGSGMASRTIAGPIGWTDDGIPVDATVAEFISAFERSLIAASRSATTTTTATATSTATTTTTQQLSTDSINPVTTVDEPGEAQVNEETACIDENLTASQEGNAVNEDSVAAPLARNLAFSEEEEVLRNDDERVASALAAGLRLSPQSEASVRGEDHHVVRELGAASLGSVTTTETPQVDQDSTILNLQSSVMEIDTVVETVAESEPATAACQGISNETEYVAVDDNAEITDTNMIESSTATVSSNIGLVCPPDIDPEVFNSLPLEMQQDCIDEYNATQELAVQLDGSSLDPSVVAALPPDVRREVIEQDRRERRLHEQDEASGGQAADLDIASFIATISSPELRAEILRTVEDSVLNSLPPDIQAEARLLRERASLLPSTHYETIINEGTGQVDLGSSAQLTSQTASAGDGVATRRKQRSGKLRVESDRQQIVYTPEHLSSPFTKADFLALFRLKYLLSPLRPPRLIQKIFHNLCLNVTYRSVISTVLVKLLHEDGSGARDAVNLLEVDYDKSDSWRRGIDSLFARRDDFPPSVLLGAALDVPNAENAGFGVSAAALYRREDLTSTDAVLERNLPASDGSAQDSFLPPVVALRLVETILNLCKGLPRFCLHILTAPIPEGSATTTCFEKLLELLEKPMYSKCAANLDQLLNVLQSAVSPLSHISKRLDEETEISQREIDAAAAAGKVWVDVPRVSVSPSRLQLLCSILRMETCRDTAFTKVNTIIRRLCRIDSNRGYVLAELVTVSHALGGDAIRDLRALRIRMESAAAHHLQQSAHAEKADNPDDCTKAGPSVMGTISSSITLSTSTSELKLLRVLQTLQALCNDCEDQNSKKNDVGLFVTEELAHLLRQMKFDELWDELSACLKVVQILEGVKSFEDEQKTFEDTESNDEASGEEISGKAKKLRNSSAGLLTRFLPSVEAFFIANTTITRSPNTMRDSPGQNYDERLIDFVTSNKILLNALVRNNSNLLDKGLRALVQVPRCRTILDFDVKRQWFQTQMRRLRQQAARRNSSLRLIIRRNRVFEDAYHHLRVRNADEMRGRLHVTFHNEEGVDAGGLSREFFAILAKEIFNPNYALFTSTEDGCTFQPNPNSSINHDHLSYFRFVGRIVGKAVSDSYLLDAHFTRSLYKHMLGMEPTHHDMEAIDPDYYRNLKKILEYDLATIGLDLTFSIQDNSFGRHQVIDLVPNGRNIPVTEDNKEDYVRKICQHRMTASIQSQINSFLDGFYDLVSKDLIAVFTPRELELLISGMPDIDLYDLKKNTDYVGWKATDKEIEWFWNILFSLSRNEKASFLQFVTGSSKVPLAGFSELQGMRGVQKFSIHKAGGTKGSLMSAHTCFNSLDLPVYGSEEEMRDRLLYSINEGGGAFYFA